MQARLQLWARLLAFNGKLGQPTFWASMDQNCEALIKIPRRAEEKNQRDLSYSRLTLLKSSWLKIIEQLRLQTESYFHSRSEFLKVTSNIAKLMYCIVCEGFRIRIEGFWSHNCWWLTLNCCYIFQLLNLWNGAEVLNVTSCDENWRAPLACKLWWWKDPLSYKLQVVVKKIEKIHRYLWY